MANNRGPLNSSDPTTSILVGGVYNATPPAPADQQPCALQLDANGNLNVNVQVGGGGGGSNASVGLTGVTAPTSATEIGAIDGTGKLQGASSSNPIPVAVISGGGSNGSVANTGAAAPSQATYIGANKAGNIVAPLLDSSGNLQTVISEALPAGTNTIGSVTGTLTPNTAAPAGTDVGTMPAISSAASPSILTDGDEQKLYVTPYGDSRVRLTGHVPNIIQKTNAVSAGSVTTLTCAYSSNVRKGTQLVVVAAGNGVATATDSQGNTYTNRGSSPGCGVSGTTAVTILTATSGTAGANTVTVTLSSSTIAVEIYEVYGLSSSAIFDVSVSGTSTGTAVTSGSVVPTTANGLAFSGIAVAATPTTITLTPSTGAGANFNNDSGTLNPSSPASGVNSFVSASAFIGQLAQPVSLSATLGSSLTWTQIVVVLRQNAQQVSGTVYNQLVESTETTTNWTSATTVNATTPIINVQGMNSVSLFFNFSAGTLTGGSAVYEGSDSASFASAYTLSAAVLNVPANIGQSISFNGRASTNVPISVNVAGFPYFRVRLSVAIIGTAALSLGIIGTAGTNGAVTGGLVAVTSAGVVIPVGSTTAQSALADNIVNSNTYGNTAGNNNPLAVDDFVYGGAFSGTTQATLTGWFKRRNPTIFQSGIITPSAPFVKVWQPLASNKFRLLKYRIEVGSDCTLSTAAPIWISFMDGTPGLTTTGGVTTSLQGLGHRYNLFTTASTTLPLYTDTTDVTLGDIGIGSQLANNGLYAMLSAPQPAASFQASAVMGPTGQWEAGGVAFKANSNCAFIQNKTNAAAAATVGVSPNITTRIGNLVVVAVRTTNIAAGAPTITCTDAGGNSYTAGTVITNASDTTNGSSLQVFYSLTTVSTGTITVTGTVHAPTQIAAVMAEYQGVTTVTPDVSATGATGNSTAPQPAAMVTTVIGDLIIGYAANGANPTTFTPGGNGLLRSYSSGSSGSIALWDYENAINLAAGGITVLVEGTEE